MVLREQVREFDRQYDRFFEGFFDVLEASHVVPLHIFYDVSCFSKKKEDMSILCDTTVY